MLGQSRIEMQRRDRDIPIIDGLRVRTRHRLMSCVGATDPKVFVTAWIAPRHDFFVVETSAQPSDSHTRIRIEFRREIHIQKRRRRTWIECRGKKPACQLRSNARSVFHGTTGPIRECNRRNASQSSLACGRHCPRVKRISTEIVAVVDPAHDEVGATRQKMLSIKCNVNAVRGRAIDRMQTIDFSMPKGTCQRKGMTVRALFEKRRNRHDFCELGESTPKEPKPWCVNAIIVGKENERKAGHGRAIMHRARTDVDPHRRKAARANARRPFFSIQSGRRDSNPRPPDPQSGALTRLRHAPNRSRG